MRANQNEQTASTRRLCYAFLRSGDLWTVCNGKRQQISFQGKATDFGFSVDAMHLAVQTRQGSSNYVLTLATLGLEPHTETKHIDGPGLLWATCGSVYLFEPVTLRALDVLTSEPVSHAPYKFFHCSSDLQVTAGWSEADEAAQLERRKQGDAFWSMHISLAVDRLGEQSHITIYGPLEFDLSPDGKHVAFFAGYNGPEDSPKICIADASGQSSCVSDQGGHTSVSDANAVLYVTEAGIKYWRPGIKKPFVVEPRTASHPQWISPKAADALQKWNSARVQTSSNRK